MSRTSNVVCVCCARLYPAMPQDVSPVGRCPACVQQASTLEAVCATLPVPTNEILWAALKHARDAAATRGYDGIRPDALLTGLLHPGSDAAAEGVKMGLRFSDVTGAVNAFPATFSPHGLGDYPVHPDVIDVLRAAATAANKHCMATTGTLYVFDALILQYVAKGWPWPYPVRLADVHARVARRLAMVPEKPAAAAPPAPPPSALVETYQKQLDSFGPFASGARAIVARAVTLARDYCRASVDLECLVQAVLTDSVLSAYRTVIGDGITLVKFGSTPAPADLSFCGTAINTILPLAKALAAEGHADNGRCESVPHVYDVDLIEAVLEVVVAGPGWLTGRLPAGSKIDVAKLLEHSRRRTSGRVKPKPVAPPAAPATTKSIRDQTYLKDLGRFDAEVSQTCLELVHEAARIATARELPTVDEECLLLAAFTAKHWDFAARACREAGLTPDKVAAMMANDPTPKAGPTQPLPLSALVPQSVLPRARAAAQMKGHRLVFDSYLWVALVEILVEFDCLAECPGCDFNKLLGAAYDAAHIVGPITGEFDVAPPETQSQPVESAVVPVSTDIELAHYDLYWAIDLLEAQSQPFTLTRSLGGKYVLTVPAAQADAVRDQLQPLTWTVLFQGSKHGLSVTRVVHARGRDKTAAITYARTKLFPDEEHCEATVVVQVPSHR